MPIIINSTTLGSSASINGTSLNTIKFNGTTVWTGIPPYYNELKNGTQLTETQWLAFLNGGGIEYIINKGEQSTFRGKKITINNKYHNDYNTWIIADFNHDDTSNTCDVVQANIIFSQKYSSNKQSYDNSSLRRNLNGYYYNAFSDGIKNRLQIIYNDSWGINDKVKLLSATEVGVSEMYMSTYEEGSKYPIFSTDSSRIRSGKSYNNSWWLRTYHTSIDNKVWYINSTGTALSQTYDQTISGAVPALRFN